MKRKPFEKKRGRTKQNRKKIRVQRLANRQRRTRRRLEERGGSGDPWKPMLQPGNVQYEVADRSRGMAHGGIGLVHKMAEEIGLPRAIDERVNACALPRVRSRAQHRVQRTVWWSLFRGH